MNSKILTLVAIAVATSSGSTWATTIFSDDYSTFAPGNLAGQHGWTATLGATSLPLQVAGGNVVVPDNQSADNQDVVKSFGSILTTTTYVGMSLNVSSAPINTPPTSVPSYFFALLESSGGFANARLTAIDNSAVIPGTYLLEARYTGQTGNPFVGGTPLFYGQTYNVVEKAIITTSPTGAGEGIQLYVNPTSNNEAAQIPYVDAPATTGFIIPPVGFQSATISQFANTTTHNVGVAIDHMYVADTFAEAARVVPEPGTIALLAMSAVGFASLGRAKRLRQIA